MPKYGLALISTLALLLGNAGVPVSSVSANDLAEPYADFGFDVLRKLSSEHTQRNVFISPYSIAVSLAMLSNGANGSTRQAILKTIHSEGQALDAFNAANQVLIEQINKTTAVQLAAANGLWIQKSAVLKPRFREVLQTQYAAEAENVDFGSPQTTETINAWAAKHTNGRIPKVISQTDPATLLLLADAIAFKGKWSLPFEPSLTKPHDFKASHAGHKVAMMSHSAQYSYSNDKSLESIRLPYGDGTFAMYVMLPHDANALQSFVEGLTATKFSTHIAELGTRNGTIELPRFSLTYETALNAPLAGLGMGIAFDNNADFSGIPERPTPLQISDVQHASFLKVDEEGTEAAAVTTTTILPAAVRPPMPPFHMVVDHPFFIAIRDERSGQILFMGVIADPKD